MSYNGHQNIYKIIVYLGLIRGDGKVSEECKTCEHAHNLKGCVSKHVGEALEQLSGGNVDEASRNLYPSPRAEDSHGPGFCGPSALWRRACRSSAMTSATVAGPNDRPHG